MHIFPTTKLLKYCYETKKSVIKLFLDFLSVSRQPFLNEQVCDVDVGIALLLGGGALKNVGNFDVKVRILAELDAPGVIVVLHWTVIVFRI